MSIADLKAMYDRYFEQLTWYQSRIIKGINYEQHDEYSEMIKELSIKTFNVGRQLEMEMDKAYDKFINKI